MFLRIESITPKKLIGKKLRMSLANDQTPQLWKSFMPERKKIAHRISNDLICMQVYDSGTTKEYLPETEFHKWAVAEVSTLDDKPDDMETYSMKGGLYAVFLHQGAPHDFEKTFRFIFHSWLPASGYVLDHREHFEILGEKYKNNDPASEEEVWIPIAVPIHS